MQCFDCLSVKANSNKSILKLLAKKGAGADVVSYGEMSKSFKSWYSCT